MEDKKILKEAKSISSILKKVFSEEKIDKSLLKKL